LWKTTVLIPLIAGLFFLMLLGVYEILDVCQAEKACDVVGTIAMWGAVGMLGFIVAARILIVGAGLVGLLTSRSRQHDHTNASPT
jgi:uncharacterized membrane protein